MYSIANPDANAVTTAMPRSPANWLLEATEDLTVGFEP
jgi:hypothetical protein